MNDKCASVAFFRVANNPLNSNNIYTQLRLLYSSFKPVWTKTESNERVVHEPVDAIGNAGWIESRKSWRLESQGTTVYTERWACDIVPRQRIMACRLHWQELGLPGLRYKGTWASGRHRKCWMDSVEETMETGQTRNYTVYTGSWACDIVPRQTWQPDFFFTDGN